jgi:hypothetical protein
MVDAKSKSFSLLNPYRLGNIFANSSKSSVQRQAFKRLLRSIRPPLLGLRIELLFVISKKADLIVNENRWAQPTSANSKIEAVLSFSLNDHSRFFYGPVVPKG